VSEIKAYLISFFSALAVGWWSKVITSITDPITSTMDQAVCRLGWVGVLFVILLAIKQSFDDYEGYIAMGVFAVPAIAALLLPWDIATGLALLSVPVLGFFGIDAVRDIFNM
jgi:hypothetical protein